MKRAATSTATALATAIKTARKVTLTAARANDGIAAMSETAPEPGVLARRVIRAADRAAMASALARDGSGWPYASLVLTAVDFDASPILLISTLADHTRNVAADGRVSLLFDGTAGYEDTLSGPRVTLLGRIEASAAPRHRARFLARHPEARQYAGFKDFRFHRVVPEKAHLVAGFGAVHWLAPEAFLFDGAGCEALAEAEADILAHMNADHAAAVALYATRLLGRGGEGWRMTGIDPEGCDLRREDEVARLPFEAPVRDAEAARGALAALAKAARG